jgi:hypothetical protein
MVTGILSGLFGAVGALAFFGFLAFATWMDYRKKKEEREAAHQERMKALELGHPPRDGEIEQARAYASAAWAAGVVGIAVPPAVFGISLGATAVILGSSTPGASVPVLCVLWVAAGVTSVVAVVMSTSAVMGRRRRWAERGTPARDPQPVGDRATTAITEQVPGMRI